jgi:hypothetical protein
VTVPNPPSGTTPAAFDTWATQVADEVNDHTDELAGLPATYVSFAESEEDADAKGGVVLLIEPADPPAPTQFLSNFSEYSTGFEPFDWSKRFVTTNGTYIVTEDATASGGKVLRCTRSVAGRSLLSWDRLGTPADVEFLVKWRYVTGSGPDAGSWIHCRASGGAGAESSYVGNHVLGATPFSRFLRYQAGGLTIVAQTALAVTVGDWQWTRMKVEGTNLWQRTWADGVAEPGTWLHTRTDLTQFADGWAGLGHFSTNTIEYDVCAVGINGDPAPTP